MKIEDIHINQKVCTSHASYPVVHTVAEIKQDKNGAYKIYTKQGFVLEPDDLYPYSPSMYPYIETRGHKTLNIKTDIGILSTDIDTPQECDCTSLYISLIANNGDIIDLATITKKPDENNLILRLYSDISSENFTHEIVIYEKELKSTFVTD